MASVRILRSSPGKAPAPRVTVSPRSARKESQLIQPGPGERILAEAAVLEPAAEGPFRVDVDEAIAFPGTARVRVTIPAEIHEAGAIQLAVTVDGPGDLHETRRAAYYNVHRVTVGCDPVPGGGPNQCRNNSWEEPLSPPSIDFGPELLNTPGPHHLAVQAPGFGEVRRTFLLVAPALERSLQVHQHRELGSYRLQARAAVVVPAATGSRPLTVSRALFRSGGRTLIVDVSDPGRTREELDAMLSTGPWAAVPWTTARDQRAIKLSRRPDGFEAAWASDLLVRAAGTGGALGDAERTVLDYYLGAFPSRQPASR